MSREDVIDPAALLRIGPERASSAPRYTPRQVLDMLDLRLADLQRWLGESAPPARPDEPETRSAAHGAARYSVNDVELLRTAKTLRQGKVPTRRIRAALASLKRRLPAGNSPLALRLMAEGEKVVVRDGCGTWEAESGQFLLDFASGHALASGSSVGASVATEGGVDYERQEDAGAGRNVLRFDDRRRGGWDASDWYERARDLELSGEEGAEQAYRKALELDAEMVDAHIDLGRLLHERGDLDGARFHYAEALEVDASCATASFNLGVVLEDLGEHDGAVSAYTGTLAVDPGYADAYYNLARLYEVRGDRASAVRCLQSYRRASRS